MISGIIRSQLGRPGIGAVLGFRPETLAILSAFTVPAPYLLAMKINWLVSQLIETGVWDDLGFLFVDCVHDSQAALVNWKNVLIVGSPVGAVTHTPYDGWNSDGVSGYVDRAVVTTAIPDRSQNSATNGVFYFSVFSSVATGTIGNSQQNILVSATTSFGGNRVNASANATATGTFPVIGSGRHCLSFIRRNAVSIVGVQDQSAEIPGTQASVAPATLNVSALLTGMTFAVPSTIVSAQWGGGALTTQQTHDLHSSLSEFYSAVQ